MDFILAIDQGTTSCRTIVFDKDFNEVVKTQRAFTQIYPEPGLVEHNPEEIWEVQEETIKQCIAKSGISISSINCIGITNQRETTVVWNKHTGKPIYNAIVWQDRRTADYCHSLRLKGLDTVVQDKTGLLLDAYFSASKINWILDHVDGARSHAEKGDLLAGTIDSWLIWKMTGGNHYTDSSNASRTLLFNIHTGVWDEELCGIFEVPVNMLPKVLNSHDEYGNYKVDGENIQIKGVAGDQQAALFGQACFRSGMGKCTYGTGCFLLMNTGKQAVTPTNGLISTVAWRLKDNLTYAIEGSVFNTGSVIQWLRDDLQIIETAAESEDLASSISDNGNIHFVPAFTGLGSPWWDMEARGNISGITRGTSRAHIVRAGLESVAYQVVDIWKYMNELAPHEHNTVYVDGGMTENNWLMQFQSDIIQQPIAVSEYPETTARGAAMLAYGILPDEEIQLRYKYFKPNMSGEHATRLLSSWHKAINRTLYKPHASS